MNLWKWHRCKDFNPEKRHLASSCTRDTLFWRDSWCLVSRALSMNNINYCACGASSMHWVHETYKRMGGHRDNGIASRAGNMMQHHTIPSTVMWFDCFHLVVPLAHHNHARKFMDTPYAIVLMVHDDPRSLTIHGRMLYKYVSNLTHSFVSKFTPNLRNCSNVKIWLLHWCIRWCS